MSLSVANEILGRVERLATITACPSALTRRVFTPEQLQAEALVQGWMEEAGLTVRRDPAGNLIGRIEGAISGGPAILIGGHIDTIENACRFDGVLGVLMGIACVEHIVREGIRSELAVEVVAFVQDAACRFYMPGYGIGAMVGRLILSNLLPDCDPSDPSDLTLRQAMQAYNLDLDRVEDARRDPSAVVTYIEVMAEPGPNLDRAGYPLGIVDALMSGNVLVITLKGVVGLGETLPMAGRRDALAGAAECIIEAERLGSSQSGVTATVGRFKADDRTSVVVSPGAKFGVFFDSTDHEALRAVMAEAEASFREIASRRGLEILIERGPEKDTLRCDPAVTSSFEGAVRASGHRATTMGTKNIRASSFASFGPIGLLLIRARGGTGWGPGAEVQAEDIAAGLDVLCCAVPTLAGAGAPFTSDRSGRADHRSVDGRRGPDVRGRQGNTGRERP